MDALLKYIIDQWAVLVIAPAAFVAALALGATIGWIAAWIILKQRLDHYKERIEHFKERFAEAQPTSSNDRAATKAQLQKFYIQLGQLNDTLLPPTAQNEDSEQFKKFQQEANDALNEMARWIKENMGEAALARFLDRSDMTHAHFSNAANGTHNRMLLNQTTFRQNLLAMIETSAWDKAQN
jgi:hypothetical protein